MTRISGIRSATENGFTLVELVDINFFDSIPALTVSAKRNLRPMRFGFPKGFTLVEMIAVLVIVALIAAVAGPRFFDINAFRESGFYDETVSAVRYAQKYAVASGCNVSVNMNPNGYALLRTASVGACNSVPGTDVVDPSSNEATFVRTCPSGITLPTTTIIFTASGTAVLAADPLTVNVGNRQFRVYGETGFVQRQ